MHCCVGHTAEGGEGRYQAGPKGRNLEVGARRAPRLLVINNHHCILMGRCWRHLSV